VSGVKVHKLNEDRTGGDIKLGAVPVSPAIKLPVAGLHQREPPPRSGAPKGFDVEWITTVGLTHEVERSTARMVEAFGKVNKS
jgi:hypothetical protein